jgi:hypothetical protein
MRLKRDRWHQMAYRKRVEIILQRRLEVLQQMLLPDAVRDEQNPDESENQFVRALALEAATRTGKEFAVWFHRPHARPNKVE